LAFSLISFHPKNPIEITGDFIRRGNSLKNVTVQYRDKPYHMHKMRSISKWNLKEADGYVSLKGGDAL
jgi:hypothetical protein